jgi:hypothetical protein
MHLLKGFCAVVSSDALGHDVVKKMLSEVHLGEIPPPRVVFLFDDEISTKLCR